MLTGRKQTWALAIVIASLSIVSNQVSAAGSYTPCMVQPVFVAPQISPPVITLAETDRPLFVHPVKQAWSMDLPDIDRPLFVQSVFAQTVFDGCETQFAQKKYLSLRRPAMLSGGASSQPAGSSVAARLLKDAAACCATGGGK